MSDTGPCSFIILLSLISLNYVVCQRRIPVIALRNMQVIESVRLSLE